METHKIYESRKCPNTETFSFSHVIHSIQSTELNFRKNKKFMPGRFVV